MVPIIGAGAEEFARLQDRRVQFHIGERRAAAQTACGLAQDGVHAIPALQQFENRRLILQACHAGEDRGGRMDAVTGEDARNGRAGPIGIRQQAISAHRMSSPARLLGRLCAYLNGALWKMQATLEIRRRHRHCTPAVERRWGWPPRRSEQSEQRLGQQAHRVRKLLKN
jgi:hypothetical protein